MTQFICTAIIIALIACWLILFITKIGVREYVQVHAPRLISQLFDCDFCLSWWICLGLAIIFSLIIGNFVLVLSAFCATPLTRYYL